MIEGFSMPVRPDINWFEGGVCWYLFRVCHMFIGKCLKQILNAYKNIPLIGWEDDMYQILTTSFFSN